MRLRANWKEVDDTRAVLNVDVRLPTYPALFCSCPVCVTKRSVFALQFAGQDEHPDHKEPEISDHDKDLIDGLLGIHGVINVWSADYRVSVEIGGVFDWQEIRPRAEAVIADWAGVELPEKERVGLWSKVVGFALGRAK